MIRTASGARADTDRGFGLFARRELVRGRGEVVSVQGACVCAGSLSELRGSGAWSFGSRGTAAGREAELVPKTRGPRWKRQDRTAEGKRCAGERGPGHLQQLCPDPKLGVPRQDLPGGFSQVGPCPLPIPGVHCQLGGRIGAGRERGPGAVVLPLPVLGGG